MGRAPARHVEAEKNKKEFQPTDQAPPATSMTDLSKRCRPAYTQPRNREPTGQQPRNRGKGAAYLGAARCSLGPEDVHIRPGLTQSGQAMSATTQSLMLAWNVRVRHGRASVT